jgi:hypothetical protein
MTERKPPTDWLRDDLPVDPEADDADTVAWTALDRFQRGQDPDKKEASPRTVPTPEAGSLAEAIVKLRQAAGRDAMLEAFGYEGENDRD